MSKACAAALLATLWLPAVPGGAAAQQAPASAASANPLAAQSLEGLAVTRERPLFSAQRRPPTPPRMAAAPPPPPPPPLPPPQVALYGIVSEAGGARAMIRANGDKIVGVRIGDDIGGWKVTRIERRQIELTLADRAISFAMFSGEPAVANTADTVAEDDDADGDDTPRRNRRPRSHE